MGITLGIVLVLAALAVVVYPFVMVQRLKANSPDPAVQRLRAARTRIYRQIEELGAELKSGEIAQEEHEAQVHELRITAARVLREMSVLESDTATEADLEREIAQVRRERASGARETDTGVSGSEADR